MREYYDDKRGVELWFSPARGGWKFYDRVNMVTPPDEYDTLTAEVAEQVRREFFPSHPPIMAEGAA